MIHTLHGNFGLPTDWDAALPQGIPAKSWHLWEIRRHHPEARTLTGFATWFNQQIAALPGEGPRVLAGYSMGGRLALHVLLDQPALWHRILLISAHPGLANGEERTARLALDAAWQRRCHEEAWPEVCAAWHAQPVLQSSSPPSDPGETGPWRAEIADAFTGWSLGQQQQAGSALNQQAVSGFWMAGGADPKFSQLALTASHAAARFHAAIVPDSGHRLLSDQPGAVQTWLQHLHG